MSGRKPSLWRHPALLTLVLIQVVDGFGFALLVPTLPEYVIGLGGGPSEVGIFSSSYALSLFVFAPIWGWLSDRTGRRFALIAGTLGLGVSYGLLAVAPSLGVAVLLRTVGGAFAAATQPASFAYVADITTPANRGRAMGMVSAGLGSAFIIGPVLGGSLAEFGLAAPFLLAAASSILAALLVWRFLESVPSRGGTQAVGQARVGAGEGLAPLVPMLMLSFLLALGDGSRATALALYAYHQVDLGTSGLGIVFSIMGLSFVLANWLAVGPAIARFGERNTVLVGMPIGIVGFLMVPFADDLATLSFAIGVQGVALAFAFTAIPAYLSRATRGGQGVAMGWRSMTLSAGQIAGPLIGGGLYELGPSLPFYGGAVFVAIALVLGVLTVRPMEPVDVTVPVSQSPLLAGHEPNRP